MIEKNVCGNVLEEIQINSEMMEQLSGGLTYLQYCLRGNAGGWISWYLGNQGKICTWTVECMGNCS